MSVPELILEFQVTCSNRNCLQFTPEDCEFEWKVPFEDRTFEDKTKHTIYSSVFPEDDDAQFKWEIEFHRGHHLVPGHNFQTPSRTSPAFYLKLKEKKIWFLDVCVECYFFIKAEDGSTFIDKKGQQVEHEIWGIYPFHDWYKLLNTIGKVPLIFGARVSARYDTNPTALIGQKVSIIAKRFIRNRNYSYSMKEKTLSDVILRTEKDGKEFEVHRFMLTSRSKVFAAMFSNDMKEKLTGLVNIQEFSGYIMRYVLYFIYNATIDFPDVNAALNLLEAAEYFDLKDLKKQCATYLLRFVYTEHVWQILLIAHLFCVEDLKATTLEYISVHRDNILGNIDEYQTFPKDLLLDINEAYSEERQHQAFLRKFIRAGRKSLKFL